MPKIALAEPQIRALRSYVHDYGLPKLATRLGSDVATIERAARGGELRPSVLAKVVTSLEKLLAAERKHVQPGLF